MLSGQISVEQLKAAVASGDIDTVILSFCDMQGRLMGKRLTGQYCLDHGLTKGTHFCVYLLGTDMEMNTPEGYSTMNWESGYGDYLARPDWSTLRIIPWLEKTALVLCDVVDEKTDELIAVAPRTILKKQVQKAEKLGIRMNMACELEFYLFKDPFEQLVQQDFRNMKPAGHYNEDYNLLQGTRNESIYQKFRNYMNTAGIPIESTKGEACAGQHEINVVYSDALTSADRHVLLKHGLKEICMQNNHAITFMAKPHHNWTGSSGHLHISLWDTDQKENLFYDPNTEPYHMSETMQYFLGGALAYTRDFSLFLASNVNSYKRFAPGSWAPVHIVWSTDNRTAGYRIVGDKKSLRIECRIPGADINPYLAYSAVIAAGLYGIENRIKPTEEFRGNAYAAKNVPRIPYSLGEAMELFRKSEVVRAVLGEQVMNHYYNMAKVENQAFEAVVTDWERSRYFEQG
jgi:glutamine synthetase